MVRVYERILIGAMILTIVACTAQPVTDAANLPTAAVKRAPSLIPPPTADDGRAQTPLRPRMASLGKGTARPRIDEFYPATAKQALGSDNRRRRSDQPGDVTLDFVDTDINKVVHAVLGDILGRNFIIDPNVTGKVTLTTDRPLHQDELIPTLEAVLAAQGARLVKAGPDIYRITRAAGTAAAIGGGIGIGGNGGDPANIQIFPLSYIGASEMGRIIVPLLPQGAILHTDDKRNLLIVGGAGQDLRLAKSTIDIFDVDQMAGQNVVMISIETAKASELVAELQTIFQSGSATGGPSGPIRFISVDRINSIMILSTQKDYIDRAREWVYRLDREHNPNDRRLFVYYVQNGRADKLVDSLREVLGNLNGRPVSYRATPTTSSATGTATPAAATAPRTQVASAASPIATPIAAAANEPATGGPLISVDTERNALLVSATTGEFSLVQDVLAKLDIQPLQVMVETTIFEVTLNDTLRYGIQYAVSNGGLGITNDGTIGLTSSALTAASGNIISPIIAPAVPGFSFTIEGNSRTRFIIDALSSITEVNVLSSPNLLALNNQVARLLVGDEVPIITQTTTSTVTDNPLIVNTVQYRNTGVSLEVTPHVNASGIVTLEITQNVSDVTPTTTSSIDSPTIQNRSLVTTVSVKSGDTVMLGGLIREDSTRTDSGIPLLHDLPVIGALFGSKSNRSSRSELVVLIRPVVSTTPADTQKITLDMQRKFHALLRGRSIGIPQPRRLTEDNAIRRQSNDRR